MSGLPKRMAFAGVAEYGDDGTDVVDLATGSGPIELTVSEATGSISAEVTGVRGEGRGDLLVTLLPSDYRRWIGSGMNRTTLKSCVLGTDWKCDIHGLLPGSYMALVVSEGISVAAADPAWIETQSARAPRVTVTAGRTEVVKIEAQAK
jgi:hypothetical protein